MTICFCCSSYMTISKVAGFKLLTKQNKQFNNAMPITVIHILDLRKHKIKRFIEYKKVHFFFTLDVWGGKRIKQRHHLETVFAFSFFFLFLLK